MFDIGFGELLLVFVIGLVVLGPQRLPVAGRTVAGWVRALRSLATTVQNELAQELKMQEFQDSLKKVEKASLDNLTPELKASMDELRQAAESMKRSYTANDPEKASDEAHTIHNPVVKDNEALHEGVRGRFRERQRHLIAERLGGLGGEVGEVHGQRFPGDVLRPIMGKEVDAGGDGIGGDDEFSSGARSEDRAVVIQAQRARVAASERDEIRPDQFVFAGDRAGHQHSLLGRGLAA